VDCVSAVQGDALGWLSPAYVKPFILKSGLRRCDFGLLSPLWNNDSVASAIFFQRQKKDEYGSKKGWKAFDNILPEFLVVILFVGVMLAVLDPQTISKLIGKNSGWVGVILAATVGSITLIPGLLLSLRPHSFCRQAQDYADRRFYFDPDDGRSCNNTC
jgi:hypothetical protein